MELASHEAHISILDTKLEQVTANVDAQCKFLMSALAKFHGLFFRW